jgi:hypothetical protein
MARRVSIVACALVGQQHDVVHALQGLWHVGFMREHVELSTSEPPLCERGDPCIDEVAPRC